MQSLSEDIVLLRLLTAEPSKPSRHSFVNYDRGFSTPPDGRMLSFANERDIVDNLSFLSATSDDPEKVTALSLEEDVRSGSCTIRIAMNSHKLGGLVADLGNIARVLETADRQSTPAEASSYPDSHLTAHPQVMVTTCTNY